MQALAFQVHAIGYPVFLMRISAWIQSAFDMDLGQFLSSPECNIDIATLPVTVLTYKLLTTMLIIPVVAMVLAIAGHMTGQVHHAFNASIAIYTVGISTVVNRCLLALDCVKGNLVSLPEQQCWQGEAIGYHTAAVIGIAFYCICLPCVLFFKLRAGVLEFSVRAVVSKSRLCSSLAENNQGFTCGFRMATETTRLRKLHFRRSSGGVSSSTNQTVGVRV